jgi:hypothetical protein
MPSDASPDNPYLDYAESVARRKRRQTKPRIVKSEREAPMVPSAADKAIAETSARLRRYEAFRRKDAETLLAGPHGPQVKALLGVLKSLTPDSCDLLLGCLDAYAWYKDLGKRDRQIILSLIADAIIRMRVRNGMAPMDDSLPGEEPTVFEICRDKLNYER